MIAEKLNTQELFTAHDKTWSKLLSLVLSVDEKNINTIPFEDSWTVAQLATHIKKSNKAIVQGLQMNGIVFKRNAEERAEELKKTFLDFTVKFQSPDFIVPENKIYKKDEVVSGLKDSIEKLKQLRINVNLSEIINLPVFGEISKLEILYFVLYHTQRHLYQLENIIRTLNKKYN